jgi:hypothetical protein
MDFAEIAVSTKNRKSERRRDDLRGFDSTWQDAGKKSVSVDPITRGEMVSQCLRLPPPQVGQAFASAGSADNAVKSRVSMAVPNKEKPHPEVKVPSSSKRTNRGHYRRVRSLRPTAREPKGAARSRCGPIQPTQFFT